MKKKVLIVLSYLAVAAAAAAVTLLLSFKPAHYTKLEALMDLLDQRYIDGVDRTELEDAAADAMVGAFMITSRNTSMGSLPHFQSFLR